MDAKPRELYLLFRAYEVSEIRINLRLINYLCSFTFTHPISRLFDTGLRGITAKGDQQERENCIGKCFASR